MGILNRIGGIVGISELDCESRCLMDITCVGAELVFGGFHGMDVCVLTEDFDFTPRRSSVLYEIVFRCPGKNTQCWLMQRISSFFSNSTSKLDDCIYITIYSYIYIYSWE